MYHLCTLCIYTSIYIFRGPPAMSKTRPPTSMQDTRVMFSQIVDARRATHKLGGHEQQCFFFIQNIG